MSGLWCCSGDRRSRDLQAEVSAAQRTVCNIRAIAGTYLASAHYKTLSIIFYDPISPTIVWLSAAAFMVGRLGSFKLSPRAKKVRDFIGSYTFGIYLSHALILDVLGDDLNVDYKICNPIISIPLIALFVYLSALLLVYIISKIPFGKWVAM